MTLIENNIFYYYYYFNAIISIWNYVIKFIMMFIYLNTIITDIDAWMDR